MKIFTNCLIADFQLLFDVVHFNSSVSLLRFHAILAFTSYSAPKKQTSAPHTLQINICVSLKGAVTCFTFLLPQNGQGFNLDLAFIGFLPFSFFQFLSLILLRLKRNGDIQNCRSQPINRPSVVFMPQTNRCCTNIQQYHGNWQDLRGVDFVHVHVFLPVLPSTSL